MTKDGASGRMFDAEHDDADHRTFTHRCKKDRHHFQFIVSPEDSEQLSDLKAFTRDLMAEAERDLGSRLDWMGIDHWNTGHPHVHVIVRGKDDSGHDLLIAPAYICHGMRARAAYLATLELGPRSDLEIRRYPDAKVEADRWTKLDCTLARAAAQREGVIDLRPSTDARVGGTARTAMVGRMQKLERLGLAESLGPARWQLSEDAESVMRALGERSDIIKRIHHGLAEQCIEHGVAEFALDGEDAMRPIIGRLVARGRDDEVKGATYAVIDGVDGRAHHVRLADAESTTEAAPGGIVELRWLEDAPGRWRVALVVLSDLPITAQIAAPGATWLDRQLVAREPVSLSSGGFGQEVRDAVHGRVEHLVGQGLARRQGHRIMFVRDLLGTLRQRELEAAAAHISAGVGLPYHAAREGQRVAGVYRRRLDLTSGRFAVVDNGVGFSLVPWSPSLERHLGREVSGIALAGRIEWNLGIVRGPGIAL